MNCEFRIQDGVLLQYKQIIPRRTLRIPEGVTKIDSHAFNTPCCFEKVIFPSTLLSIADEAFKDNGELKEVVFSTGLESIGRKAFKHCALEECELPGSLKQIGAYAFSENKIRTLAINNAELKIGESAFEKNKYLYHVVIDQCNSLQSNIFDDCHFILFLKINTSKVHLSINTFSHNLLINSFKYGDDNQKANTAKLICQIINRQFTMPQSIIEFLENPELRKYIFEQKQFSGERAKELLPSLRSRHNMELFTAVQAYCLEKSEKKKAIAFGSIASGTYKFVKIQGKKEYLLKEYLGNEKVVFVPRVYKGCPVTEIAADCFKRNCNIQEVYAENVTLIGKEAFSGCRNLVKAVLSDKCVLSEGSFCKTESLKAISLPAEMEDIPNRCFAESGLETIDLKSIRSIGEAAFEACSELRKVINLSEECELHDLVFWGCEKLADDYGNIIVNDVYMQYIGSELEEVTIPSHVKTIGPLAFIRKELKKLVLPENAELRPNAFCKLKLPELQIPEGAVLNEKTFYYAEIDNIKLPSCIKKLPPFLFESCRTNALLIPDGVVSIGEKCFYSSALTYISLPDSLEIIENGAFACCESITEIDLRNTHLKQLGADVFSNCESLQEIYFPDTLRVLPQDAVSSCPDLLYIDLGNGIQKLETMCIEHCHRLVAVEIPKSVNILCHDAFCHNRKLQKIIVRNDELKIQSDSFTLCDDNLEIIRDGRTMIWHI